tara:strand:- start:26 stop:220 length:195 start_codon:yes stop_codon:yes gene_type:complete
MSKKNGVQQEEAQAAPVNLEDQMRAIESQIAELRGIHNYLNSLKEGGFDLIPPSSDGKEAEAQG